jgi:hypothetical protein
LIFLAIAGAFALMLGGLPDRTLAMPEEITMSTTTDNLDRAPTMDPKVKSDSFREVLKKMGAGEKIDPKLWSTFVEAQNDGIQTGPDAGSKVPDFALPDQHAAQHSFAQLTGPKGLLLVFLRSADW